VRTAFIDTLLDLARRDPRIVLITGDLGFGVVDRFMQELPAQFVNAGVAEQNMTGLAAGMALSGKTVFTYSIANFPVVRCLEQIRNDVCYHNASVKIVAVGGGFAYGALGYSHHAVEDIAFMRALPAMTVVAPIDPVEAELATRAVATLPGPCYLRLGRAERRNPCDEIGTLLECAVDRLLDGILKLGRRRKGRKIGQLERGRRGDADTLRKRDLRVSLLLEHRLQIEGGLRRLLPRMRQLGTCAEPTLQSPLRRVFHRAGGIQ